MGSSEVSAATMTNDSTPNFEIPHEMRQLVQLSLEQAQKAVNDSIAAGHKVAAAMEGQKAGTQASAKNAARRTMEFAEQNVAISFEFARKLVHAKIAQIQPDFVKAQTATLREQAKELGQTMA
jgi:hypothetical protein